MLLTEFLIQHREFAHGLSAGDIGVGLVDVLLDQRLPDAYVSWAARELSVAVELGILTLDELE